MGKSTYYKKRIKLGLTKADMANELGISYERYNLIEGGDVKMPNKLIDKFNEIINRGKGNKINSLEYGREAEEFWNAMCERDEKNKPMLYKKMKEFNIMELKTLAKLLGYKSPGMIYMYLKNPAESVYNIDFKKRLYSFFNNELNIQETVKTPVKKRERNYSVDEELTKYYEETDFKKLMQEHGITSKELCDKLGIEKSGLSRMINKHHRLNDTNMRKVKDFFDSLSFELSMANDLSPVEITTLQDSMPVLINTKEPSIVAKYKDELNEIDDMVAYYERTIQTMQNDIENLTRRKEVCLEVLSVIDKIITER